MLQGNSPHRQALCPPSFPLPVFPTKACRVPAHIWQQSYLSEEAQGLYLIVSQYKNPCISAPSEIYSGASFFPAISNRMFTAQLKQ